MGWPPPALLLPKPLPLPKPRPQLLLKPLLASTAHGGNVLADR